jgi:hypothetical protein
MNDCFLNRAAPLYQMKHKLTHLEPMDYAALCGACGLDFSSREFFTRYALVGGIPKYWEFVEAGAMALDLAEELFFGRSAFLEDDPVRILREERIAGLSPLSVLEAVGRGASKTSEIAARLGIAQTNLGRTLQQLLDASPRPCSSVKSPLSKACERPRRRTTASAIQTCVFGSRFTPPAEASGTASRLKKKRNSCTTMRRWFSKTTAGCGIPMQLAIEKRRRSSISCARRVNNSLCPR